MSAHTKQQHIRSRLPHELFTQFHRGEIPVPETFSWLANEGNSFVTRSVNQNLPTHCGSSWAHAAVSVLMDRIKIIRMMYLLDEDLGDSEDGNFPAISLSTQFILNCGAEMAGSCKGG